MPYHCPVAFQTSSVAESPFTLIQRLTIGGKKPLGSHHNVICFSNMFSQIHFQIGRFTVLQFFCKDRLESKEASKCAVFFKPRRLSYCFLLPVSSFPFLLVSVALPSALEWGLVNSAQQETCWKGISLLSKQQSQYLPFKSGGKGTTLATMETLPLPSLRQLSRCSGSHCCISFLCCTSIHCCISLDC